MTIHKVLVHLHSRIIYKAMPYKSHNPAISLFKHKILPHVLYEVFQLE